MTDTPFQAAVRAGYLAGKTTTQIAEETGSTRNSVKVTACRLGLSHKDRDHAYAFRTRSRLAALGVEISHAQVDDFRTLRRKGYSVEEAARTLGVVA